MPDYKFQPFDEEQHFDGSDWICSRWIFWSIDGQMAKKIVDENPGRYRIVRKDPRTGLVIVYQ